MCLSQGPVTVPLVSFELVTLRSQILLSPIPRDHEENKHVKIHGIFYFVVTLVANVRTMKPVHICKGSYFVHFAWLYTFNKFKRFSITEMFPCKVGNLPMKYFSAKSAIFVEMFTCKVGNLCRNVYVQSQQSL